MARNAPTPVRFDADVARRLASFAASHPGLSLSGAANLLVDEALRMSEHPGVVFRDGPTGRRAGLSGGPDIWEVVRAVKSARRAEPDLTEEDLLTLVAMNTGVPDPMLRTALTYWATFPSHVERCIDAADDAETAAQTAWQRQRDLFAD